MDVEDIVWTWGINTKGELGLGDIAPRTVPYPNSTLKDKSISQVIAGEGYSVALTRQLHENKIKIDKQTSSSVLT